MEKQRSFDLRSWLALTLLAVFLSGCVTTESNIRPAAVSGGSAAIGDGLLSVLVAPGKSASCRNESCRIYYQMPNLGRDADVVVNHFLVGSFPSGEVVDLGTWSDPNVSISIPDSEVPISYVNMYGNSGQ